MTQPSKQTYRFSGAITAVTGLTVTRPDDTFASPPNSPFRLSRKAGRLPRMGALREDSPVYFPATSLRGAIRRAGRNLVRRAVIQATGEETPWSVDTHYMLTQGVDTTNQTLNEKVAGAIGVENDLRDENPFLSLFGRWKLPGHLGIDNALPRHQNCVYVEGKGARSNDFNRDPDQVKFLSVEEAKRLKDVLEQDALAAEEAGDIDGQIRQLKKDISALTDKDEKAEVNEQIKALEAKKKAVKSAKAGSQESIQRPIEGFEAIQPGTTMDHRMLVQNATDLELGLFLACLRELARNPVVGGHRSLNCGEIRGEWTVRYWPETETQPIVAGTVSLSSEGFEVQDNTDDAVLTGALNAWDAAAKDPAGHKLNFERFLLVA
ncbi:MAG: CRISPR type aferr-associated protein csf2 [Marinobacter sp. T13-3]|nr:MAG: CRISPR type aferr-associated protein csf2 [Marinobacter sp. T13-3]